MLKSILGPRTLSFRCAIEPEDLRRLFARGPYVTPDQKQMFVLEGDVVVSDEELIALWRAGELNHEGVRRFAARKDRPGPAPVNVMTKTAGC